MLQKFRNLSTRTKVAGVSVVAAGALLLGSASSALFSDSDNTAAYAQTGKVVFQVTPKVAVGNVLPGVPRSADVEFDNTGSTAPVKVSLSSVSPVNRNNPGGSNLDLLTVKLVSSDGHTVLGPVPFDELQPGDLGLTISAGQKWTGKAVFDLPQSAGNEYQNVAVHYAQLTFTGTQAVS